MNVRRVVRRLGPVVLIAGACLGSMALAADELSTITVEAGVVNKTVVGHSDLGAPIEQVTLSRRVSFSDLDLATNAGAVALKKRVEEAARASCKQLDELYPLEEKHAPECIDKAVAAASPQVDEAIAAAERAARSE